AAAAAATLILTSVQLHYLLRIELRTSMVSSARFFRHLLRLPIDFYMQRQPAEVSKRVSANDTVAEILSRDLGTTVPPLLAAADSGLVLLFGGLRAVDGTISIGILIAFQTLLSRMSLPVTQ